MKDTDRDTSDRRWAWLVIVGYVAAYYFVAVWLRGCGGHGHG